MVLPRNGLWSARGSRVSASSDSGVRRAVEPPQSFTLRTSVTSLLEVIQLQCLNNATAVLRLDWGGRTGYVHFRGGQLTHAELGELRGERALAEMIRWPSGDATEVERRDPPQDTIKDSWQVVLIRHAHALDRGRLAAKHAQSGSTAPPPLPRVEVVTSPAEPPHAPSPRAATGRAPQHDAAVYATKLGELIGQLLGLDPIDRLEAELKTGVFGIDCTGAGGEPSTTWAPKSDR